MDQTKLLQSMKLFLFDMDGTLYLGNQLYPFTIELLNTIKANGGKYLFMTNNSSKSVLDYVKNQDDFAFVDGFVALPKQPGLGVDVNKELVVEENKTPHNWKNPVWHHADGSVAEW
jgi:phosphoserine phosphatase